MTTLLAIDTAADICSVAIARGNTLCHRSSPTVRKHAADVLPMIQSLLDETGLSLRDMNAIVMVSGPGSFTGLRIGAAVAQGLSFGTDIPIIRISSLMMLARAAFVASGQVPGTESVFHTCLHAREDEYYFAIYQDDGIAEPLVLTPDQISDATSILNQQGSHSNNALRRFCAGSGWLQQAFQDMERSGEMPEPLTDVTGNAVILCELGKYAFAAGRVDTAEQALPVYLKEDMAYRKS